MKILLLIAFSFFIVTTIFSQLPFRNSYITVTFEQNTGALTKKSYFKIVESSGNQFAWEIISLVNYDEWNNTIYTDMFYDGYLDSTRKYYNFFEKTADAFQFLADNSWELVTVCNEVYSQRIYEYYDGKQLPVNTVYSRPVYYFKKQIQ
jgi:hypothetical protein